MSIEKILKAVVKIDGAISTVPYSDEQVVRGLNTLVRGSCKGYHLRAIITHLVGAVDLDLPRVLDSTEPAPYLQVISDQIQYSHGEDRSFRLEMYPSEAHPVGVPDIQRAFLKQDLSPRKSCRIAGSEFLLFDNAGGRIEFVNPSSNVSVIFYEGRITATRLDEDAAEIASMDDLLAYLRQVR